MARAISSIDRRPVELHETREPVRSRSGSDRIDNAHGHGSARQFREMKDGGGKAVWAAFDTGSANAGDSVPAAIVTLGILQCPGLSRSPRRMILFLTTCSPRTTRAAAFIHRVRRRRRKRCVAETLRHHFRRLMGTTPTSYRRIFTRTQDRTVNLKVIHYLESGGYVSGRMNHVRPVRAPIISVSERVAAPCASKLSAASQS